MLGLGYTKENFDSLFTWAIAGILIGARLGYVFFYKPGYYLANPMEIILPLTRDELGYHFAGIAGMSYHGGMILGTIFAIIGIKRNKMDLWKTLNLSFLAAPLAYTWGRWGNFINGELFGEATTSPIGMYFPLAHDSPITNPILHHPSQLYEMCFEGVILFGKAEYTAYWMHLENLDWSRALKYSEPSNSLTAAAIFTGSVETSNLSIVATPDLPCKRLSQRMSGEFPRADTQPIPVMTTSSMIGFLFNKLTAPNIANIFLT